MCPNDLKLFLLRRKDQSRKSQEDSALFYNMIFLDICDIHLGGPCKPPPMWARVKFNLLLHALTMHCILKRANF